MRSTSGLGTNLCCREQQIPDVPLQSRPPLQERTSGEEHSSRPGLDRPSPEGYGLHGTSSHGSFPSPGRMAASNWDAARVAASVAIWTRLHSSMDPAEVALYQAP